MSNIKELINNTEQYQYKFEPIIRFSELEVPEIPEILLPEKLIQFGKELKESTEVSSSMIVASILGVLSTALSKKYVVQPKKGWKEPINIYTLVALPPANNKSLVLKEVSQPLIEHEKELFKKNDSQIKKERSKYESYQAVIKGKREKLKKCKDEEREKLIAEIEELEANLREPRKHIKYFSNNFTPEALCDEVAEQNGKFAILSDEGGLIENLSGLYSGGNSNIDIILKGIDGGDIRIKRKTYAYDLNPYLTFLLVVQPQIIENMAAKKPFTGVGLLERFLYVIPKSNLGYKTLDTEPISDQARYYYNHAIKQLLELPEGDEPEILKLSDEALAEWKEFHNAIQVKLRPDGELNICVGWAGKLAGFALRIAALIHVCDTMGKDKTISIDAMNKALDICGYLTKHAIAVYANFGADESINDAKQMIPYFKSCGKTKLTKSEIITAFKNRKFSKKDRLDKALNVLIDRNFLSEPIHIEAENTNKPITVYRINPQIKEL